MSADETLIPKHEKGWPESRGLLLLHMTADIGALTDCRHLSNLKDQNRCPECVVHLVELQKQVSRFRAALLNGDFISKSQPLTPQRYP